MSTPAPRRAPLALGRGEDPSVYALRLYVQYLQGLFNFMPEGSYHWEPDDEISEIVIRAEAPLNMQTVGKRPAITVIMGPYQFSNIGIDNMLSVTTHTDEYGTHLGAKKVRTDLMTGHIVVYCVADNDLAALRLGHLVQHHTRVNQRLLESEGGFHAIARPSPTVNSPSPPGQLIMGDPQSLIMTQVNIPFQLQWTWETTPKQSAQFRSLSQITSGRRASEYDYVEPQVVEKVQLAMSTSAVLVRRLRRASITSAEGPRSGYQAEVTTVHSGVDDFQISGLEDFQA